VISLGPTPSQTAGPYFSMRLAAPGENTLVSDGVTGQRIRIAGVLLDGDGRHIEDGLIEIWQANGGGRYRHPDDRRESIPLDSAFSGFGRVATSFEDGTFLFDTIKPGQVPDPEGELQAPHIGAIIQGRGMLRPVYTRIYFSDEEEANEHDLVLGMVPADRRHTLVARRVEASADPVVYEITLRFQGPDETVFFDF
jgi:protocatechuate 3,4-dioxygenase, alpha subunit